MIDLRAREASSGLFVSPWAWVMVFVLLVILCGLWFVQTRGAVLLGAGVFCLVFNLIFYIGARNKINAIIGDIVALVRRLPILGPFLGELVREISKNVLSVSLAPGYYLLIPAGVLLIAGGSLRLSQRIGWDRGVRH